MTMTNVGNLRHILAGREHQHSNLIRRLPLDGIVVARYLLVHIGSCAGAVQLRVEMYTYLLLAGASMSPVGEEE